MTEIRQASIFTYGYFCLNLVFTHAVAILGTSNIGNHGGHEIPSSAQELLFSEPTGNDLMNNYIYSSNKSIQ